MSKEIKIAGSISFGGKRLNVYGDLDAPLFKAKDIGPSRFSDGTILLREVYTNHTRMVMADITLPSLSEKGWLISNIS